MIIQSIEAADTKGYFRLTAQWEEGEIRHLPEGMDPDGDDPDHPLILISEEVRFRRGLQVGSVIALPELAELIRDDQLVKARDQALHMLDYRMRTKKEVEDKLRESGFLPAVIDQTLESLAGYGFLDDGKYAQAYLKDRIRQRGARAIAQELSRKGVDRDVTAELLDAMGDAEEAAALEACTKKIRNLRDRGLDDAKIREKTWRFLLSRGYDYNMVKKVYNIALESLDEE